MGEMRRRMCSYVRMMPSQAKRTADGRLRNGNFSALVSRRNQLAAAPHEGVLYPDVRAANLESRLPKERTRLLKLYNLASLLIPHRQRCGWHGFLSLQLFGRRIQIRVAPSSFEESWFSQEMCSTLLLHS